MLTGKLMGAGGVGAGIIEYVGGGMDAFVGTTSNTTRTIINSLWTDGIGGPLQEGDMVVVFFVTANTQVILLEISGYTNIVSLYANGTYDTNLYAFYKFMGPVPDSTFTCVGGTGDTRGAGAVTYHVFRGVDQSEPFDASVTFSTGINSSVANPPPITTVTDGAYVVSCGATGGTRGTATFSSGDLGNFKTIGADDTYDVTNGSGYKFMETAGTFDPAQFGFSVSSSTNSSWAGITIALKPA